MTPKSVKKKMKTPAFAAAVDRDELRAGAEKLGVDFDEHVAFVIAALDEHADELGLDGREPAATWMASAEDHRPRGRRDRPGAARAGLRVLDPERARLELELERFDLSLENRRETGNEVVDEAARAMREAGYGLKAAT